MPRIRIDQIIDHLSNEMRSALEEAVSTVSPGTKIDAHALHYAFVRAVGRKCATWHRVPDRFVEED